MLSFSRKFWIISLVLVIIASNAIWAVQYSSLKGKLQESEAKSSAVTRDSGILDFTRMFIDKVIGAKGEIDFDTRLALENSVRNLKDPEILSAWQAFLASKTEAEAQGRVRDLLSVLLRKVRG
jgi:hypothetical protein